MDAEELILHDQEAKRWLDDIESFRRPPPVKKLVDAEQTSTNADDNNVENGDKYSNANSDDSHHNNKQQPDEDFTSKLRKFQLSDCHPYSSRDRVDAYKKLAATAGRAKYGAGMLSLAVTATHDKRKQVITKEQADALRNQVTKLTRPINPYSSPRSDSDSPDRNSSLYSSPSSSSYDKTESSFWQYYNTDCHLPGGRLGRPADVNPTVENGTYSCSAQSQPTQRGSLTTAPIASNQRPQTAGYNTVMADREVSRIMGSNHDDSYRHRMSTKADTMIPSSSSSSSINSKCTATGNETTLKLAPDNLLDGSNHPILHNNVSDSFNNKQSSLANQANSRSATSTSAPVYGKEALRYQQIKYEAIKRQVELEMTRENVPYGECASCRGPVSRLNNNGGYHALGSLYHSECFVCCCCGSSLCNKKFYHFNGRIYCEQDYMYVGYQEAAEKCSRCGHMILDMIVQAAGKPFHPSCFCCQMCNTCLDGVPFTVDNRGLFYCIPDYHKLFAPKCAKCHSPITPVSGTVQTVRVVAMDRDFHVDCYVCEGCSMPLTDEPDKRCYPLGDHLLCKSCHICWSRTGGMNNPITDV